ncbi:hypothetical protein F5Y13DRAFT_158052 [Hypoxylon sp. FL1857]|nr:hypothetical protein F5Y13DRAFT_158052 [Hypoxylon sp. FL1857]
MCLLAAWGKTCLSSQLTAPAPLLTAISQVWSGTLFYLAHCLDRREMPFFVRLTMYMRKVARAIGNVMMTPILCAKATQHGISHTRGKEVCET